MDVLIVKEEYILPSGVVFPKFQINFGYYTYHSKLHGKELDLVIIYRQDGAWLLDKKYFKIVKENITV